MTWSCNARANVNYETLKTMRDNGLRLLLVGYESGNQRILDNIKKGIRIEEAREFTANCKKLGITIHGTFILGLPGETPETIRETIEFAKALDVFSHPGEPRRAVSRHGALPPGEGEWLVQRATRDLVDDARPADRGAGIRRAQPRRNLRAPSSASTKPTTSARAPSRGCSARCSATGT